MRDSLMDLPNNYVMGIDFAKPGFKDCTVFSIWHKVNGDWVQWDNGRAMDEKEFEDEVARIAKEYMIPVEEMEKALKRWGYKEDKTKALMEKIINTKLGL